MKEETKDLKYWKLNAEEDYIKTPISVLRYISELEKSKEMEKEQIKDAFIFSKDPFGVSIGNSHTIKKAEDYYNTTFKSE